MSKEFSYSVRAFIDNNESSLSIRLLKIFLTATSLAALYGIYQILTWILTPILTVLVTFLSLYAEQLNCR